MKMKSTLIGCLGVMLAGGPVAASDLVRTLQPIEGGCRVVLNWTLSGQAKSDLVIEEVLPAGWYVDGSTVPYAMLDATAFNGTLARFAIGPSRLQGQGELSFVVRPANDANGGTVTGSWMLYLGGELNDRATVGNSRVVSLEESEREREESQSGAEFADIPITGYQIVGGSFREFSYTGVDQRGLLAVEGCDGLGSEWIEIKRLKVSAGDGKVVLSASEIGNCCFIRLKFKREGK